MTFTWIITTTSGLLLILRSLHLLFTVLWLGLIFPHSGSSSSQQRAPIHQCLPLASAVLSTLTGAVLFYLTPSPPHTSWGFAIITGSALALLMLANQVLAFVYRIETGSLNITLAVPVIFLMSMGSHVGIQISPSSSISLVVGISLLPALVVEAMGLFPKTRKLLAKPVVFSFLAPLLTAVIYITLEIFSKVG